MKITPNGRVIEIEPSTKIAAVVNAIYEQRKISTNLVIGLNRDTIGTPLGKAELSDIIRKLVQLRVGVEETSGFTVVDAPADEENFDPKKLPLTYEALVRISDSALFLDFATQYISAAHKSNTKQKRQFLEPKEYHEISGLFLLAEHPRLSVKYKGKNSLAEKDWIPFHKRTQPFALLALALKRYETNQRNRSTVTDNSLTKLNFNEIKSYFADANTCTSGTFNYDSSTSSTGQLQDLIHNVKKTGLRFIKEELYIEENKADPTNPYLVFQVL